MLAASVGCCISGGINELHASTLERFEIVDADENNTPLRLTTRYITRLLLRL